MRINQIMEADAGSAKQSSVIARLENAGGDVIGTATSSNGDVAKIGINGQAKSKVYFVVYPDGTFDRFQGDAIVIYRTGYTGPAINDPKEAARRIRAAQEAQDRAKEQRAYDAQRKKEAALMNKREALRTKYNSVKIPSELNDLIGKVESVFDQVMNEVGPDLRSGLASYDDDSREEETTTYYDPAVILDLVCDRMADFTRGLKGNSEYGYDITPEEWKQFNNLPIKYQLKVAARFAGAFDY
jgi:hypothetical protein